MKLLDHFVIVQVDPPKPETLQESIDRACQDLLGKPITDTTLTHFEIQIQDIFNAAVMRGEIESAPRPLAIAMPNFNHIEIVARPTSEHEARVLWEHLQGKLSKPEQMDVIDSLCHRVPEFFSNETIWLR